MSTPVTTYIARIPVWMLRRGAHAIEDNPAEVAAKESATRTEHNVLVLPGEELTLVGEEHHYLILRRHTGEEVMIEKSAWVLSEIDRQTTNQAKQSQPYGNYESNRPARCSRPTCSASC